MNRCFDPYPFIDVVNKFYGAVYQGLDNNLLGNRVINLCICLLVQQVLWRRCQGLDNNLLVNCVINLCICLLVQQVLWRRYRGFQEFSKSIF